MRRLAASLALAAALAGPHAWAVSNSATVTPGNLTASLQSTLPTTLIWTVSVTFGPTSAAPPLALTSPQGTVTTPSGQVLQIDPLPLTVHLAGGGGQGSVVENFALTPSTIATALHMGINTLLLRRTFGVPPYGGVATALITLSGGAGGPLTLSRVMLHFDDRTLVRVLRPGESAVAIAEITFSGTGTLSGLWEVASPPSTQGEPVFVPLGSSTINLAPTGLTEVTSPVLPAASAGAYYVRFRVRNPTVPFESLVLRYGVEDASPEITPIDVTGPEPHAILKDSTRFAWQPAPEAVAYRLELFDPDLMTEDSRPISGMWVPEGQRETLLSTLAQTHLRAGQAYKWRIVALDGASQVVGQSALYEIRTP